MLVGALGLLVAVGCNPWSQPQLNVLIVSVDTLDRRAVRTFDASAPPQPALDALARESVRFPWAVSTASWTLPAHASLFTGLYPGRSGARNPAEAIASEVLTLPEVLQREGYRTVAFTGGAYVGRRYGFDRGFDRYEVRPLPRSGRPRPGSGGWAFKRARRFLEGYDAGEPFLLLVHTFQVHDYFKVQPWVRRRVPEARPAASKRYAECLRGERDCSPREWSLLKRLYRAEVRYLDRQLEGLLDALEASGLEETTLVVLLSDHGEGFAPERHRIHHGGRVDADVVRIPLLMRIPGRPPGRVDDPISLVDIMPTILELVGVEAPPRLDGLSFARPLLDGAPAAARVLFATEHHYLWREGRRVGGDGGLRPLAVAAIRPPDWVVHVRETDGAEPGREGAPAAAAATRESLRREAERMAHDRGVAANPAEPDAALRRRLRALGYLD